MQRSSLLRTYYVAAIVVATACVALELATEPNASPRALLFFAALVMLSSFLRVDERSIGFEAAPVFGAMILYHDPVVAIVPVFAGIGLRCAYDAFVDRAARRVEPFYEAAELGLSYYVVALLYASAVARTAPLMAKVSGYILLMVGCVVAHLIFASIRRYLDEERGPLDFRSTLASQTRTLLLVSPIVGLEVMSFAAYGGLGFAAAYLPVLLVAYALRRESVAEKQNADLIRRNRELSILTESAAQILSAEGDEETLRRMVSLLGGLAKLKACAVVTWEMNPEIAGTVYRYGECLPTDQEIGRWVDSAGFAQSAPSRAFVFQNELRRFPLSNGNGIQVLIGIQTVEVIYGILIYETEDASIIKTGNLNLLTLLVNQTAVSLQDQLLRREMRDKTEQLEAQAATMSTILEVSNGLIGSFDIDAMLTRIALAVRTALGFEVVVFALFDPKKDEFVRRAHAGLDDVWEEVRKKHVSSSEIRAFFNEEFRISGSFFVSHTALVQSEHGFFVRPDDSSDKLVAEWHENDMIMVPLMSADQVIGYLSVREPHDRRVPTMEKLKTLEIFAVQAVTALQSARQYEEIKRLTAIDALTPAYNHRYFQEALAKEIHRHQRTGHQFVLAMLDIDNFKRFNDTFGHPVGDEILKGLVDELLTNVRDMDVVARYGGEEFAIIFPETRGVAARDAANRLRELVGKREFALPQVGRALRITVSIGVAIFPEDGETNADLINHADIALYQAKKNGRNQVVLAADVAANEATGA
jgi:diguanylate cyclase (GGDEF)-like protein